MSHRIRWIVVAEELAAAFLFIAPTLRAQILYGFLVGTVADRSGATIPGSPVTITNGATGVSREAITDEAGRYSIPNILSGIYALRVSAPGFRAFERPSVDITINTVIRIDVRLEVRGTSETVTVSATAAMLQTDTPGTRANFGEAHVTNLPMPAYRNYQSVLNLVPGATPTEFQNGIIDTPGRSLTTNINGTARNNNNTRVDGAANVYIWLPHHTLYNPPVEAIETVDVATSAFDADQCRLCWGT